MGISYRSRAHRRTLPWQASLLVHKVEVKISLTLFSGLLLIKWEPCSGHHSGSLEQD